MSKQEFLVKLRKGLSGLPQNDIEEYLTFYSEMIEERMEDGIPEEDAVSGVGSVDEIVAQAVTERIKSKRRLRAGEILLLTLGSPIWLSVGIAILAIILALYISMWAVIISMWAVLASLIACSMGGVLACIVLTVGGNGTSGVVMLAAGIVCAGLAIFLFYGCKAGTDGILVFTKKMAIWIKNCFIKKEVA